MKKRIALIIIVSVIVIFVFLLVKLLRGSDEISEHVASPAASCVKVTVDVCSKDLEGTVTNYCTQTVSYVKAWVIAYDSSGEVLDRVEEYVEDIDPEESKDFRAVIIESGKKISNCKVEIEEASYQ
jgi:hypothetical protein